MRENIDNRILDEDTRIEPDDASPVLAVTIEHAHMRAETQHFSYDQAAT